MNILVIEDHRDIATAILDYFEARGHAGDAAHDGVTGLHFAVSNDYDAIVLDLGLPGMDGLELARQLRETARKSTPIVMLTARDTLEDKLNGFERGADDYLVKPFELPELEARIEAVLRRVNRSHDTDRLVVADLVFDVPTRTITRDGQRLRLTPTEQRLLMLLMRNAHRVVKRQELEQEIWGHTPPESDALRTHMAALRTAIDKPFESPLLHTVHGVGYRLCDAAER